MTALSELQPRSAAAIIKEPAAGLDGSLTTGDEVHRRAGVKCCCLDHYTRVGTPTSKAALDSAASR